MKKYLFLLFLTATVSDVFAQDYYTGKSTITAGGITYRIENMYKNYMLYVYDQNNKCEPFGSLYYHDGSLADRKRLGALMRQVADNGDILRATFTKDEYAAIQHKIDKTKIENELDHPLTVALIVNPEGKVIEVSFYMTTDPEFLAIPPEKLALLEQNIKKLVKWRVSEDGKKLKYTYSLWIINFSNDLSYPDEVQPDPPGRRRNLIDR